MVQFLGWRPFKDAVLLGDSGYKNYPWLLTPNVSTDLPLEGKARYLRRQRSTRQMVECSIGILKSKFPCLHHLRLQSPKSCCRVILACITLHNMERITKSNDNSFGSMETSNGYIDREFTTAEDVLADIIAQSEAE